MGRLQKMIGWKQDGMDLPNLACGQIGSDAKLIKEISGTYP